MFWGRNKIFKECDWTQPNRRQGDLGNGFRRMRSRILEVRLDFYSEQFLFEQTFSFSSFRKRKWKIKTTFAGVRPRAPSPSLLRPFGGTQHFHATNGSRYRRHS